MISMQNKLRWEKSEIRRYCSFYGRLGRKNKGTDHIQIPFFKICDWDSYQFLKFRIPFYILRDHVCSPL